MENLENLEQVKREKWKKENKDIFQILDIDTNFLKLVPWFDGHAVRIWEYSAKYFTRTKEIVADIADENQVVTMQVFQKTAGATVCGVDIVENIIKFASGEYQDEEKNEAYIKSVTFWGPHEKIRTLVEGIGFGAV